MPKKSIGAQLAALRYAKQSPEERSAAARHAAQARFADRPRCPCGATTLARALARGHRCVAPVKRGVPLK